MGLEQGHEDHQLAESDAGRSGSGLQYEDDTWRPLAQSRKELGAAVRAEKGGAWPELGGEAVQALDGGGGCLRSVAPTGLVIASSRASSLPFPSLAPPPPPHRLPAVLVVLAVPVLAQ
ncbi:hypothetical protein POSPLADRAFT_1053600 [Postia placenta MAD-698-R-SB12]|uniref:Uncharacterized protein n=1 Tax=Postia placenta MAD-698-R-SB12 TaxID=670580 RepID=A0A1X6N824_9APHY|nr:hypothetical protein POSPLADRAFT_1053600 [Postia placenta MAD-698-R-SB12]OSX64788.1 hypothetical protein POSPLADRAFT_1053600 [Postia placenta MAD-698-R-SB12]